MTRVAILVLLVLGVGLYSMAIAKEIGSVPVAWGMGFFTAALFRLIDHLMFGRRTPK